MNSVNNNNSSNNSSVISSSEEDEDFFKWVLTETVKFFFVNYQFFRSKEQRSSRKPRQRRARLCVNTKPRIRVTNMSSGARRRQRGEEGDTEEEEEEVFSRQSDAGE